jgi:hypothetical protein
MRPFIAHWRLLSLASLCAAFTGCATVNNVQQLKDGPGIDIDAGDVKAHREAQDKVLTELYALAGVNAPAAGSPDWDPVVIAGMDYADSKCEAYMQALFRLNRDRHTTVSEIGLLGTATAGILAATEAAAKDVAIVAIAFGLASASVDNLSSNLLYDLDPSSVRTLVKALQAAYRQNLQPGYRTRPAAVAAIRAYSLLCVPANIEAEVNLSVKQASPSANQGVPSKGQPPTVTNATTVVSSDQPFQNDANSELLRTFIAPGGVLNADKDMQLAKYISDELKITGVSNASFLDGAHYAQARATAVQHFGLSK